MHVTASLVLIVAKLIVDRVLRSWLFGLNTYMLATSLAPNFVVCWAIVAVAHGLHYYRMSRDRQLRASQLEAPRMPRARSDRMPAGGTETRLRALLDDVRRSRRYLTRFVVKNGDRLRLLDAAQVDWIEAADNYAVHSGRASGTIRETMNRLAGELDPEKFVGIHRSTIVQIARVRELLPAFHGDFIVVLHDGTRLNMSRVYRRQVEAVLGRTL